MLKLQFHPFKEGNTRTVVIFLIKYLRKRGYNINNDLFANNAWYFRNAIVRANYNNQDNNINETKKYLIFFLRNLLLNEDNELSNRTLHIYWDESKKPDIEDKNPDIEDKKPDIEISNILEKQINILENHLSSKNILAEKIS